MAELLVIAVVLLVLGIGDWVAEYIEGGEEEMKNRAAVHARRVEAAKRAAVKVPVPPKR